jgi:hypothetical protein
MRPLQQVLLELQRDYMGQPYYVAGHALYPALTRRLGDAAARDLQVSMGMFVPGAAGTYPEAHSQLGGVPYLGTSLRPVETYQDLFLFRDSAQRWLAADRPRESQNTQPLRQHGDRLAYGSDRRFGRPPHRRATKRTMTWYVHAYLHADGPTSLPLEEDVLDGLRLGGARNYGLGETSLADTQVVDLDELRYDRLQAANAYQLELCTPYVLASEYPGAAAQTVPSWWQTDGRLRRRQTAIVKGDDVCDLATVDPGAVVLVVQQRVLGHGGSPPATLSRSSRTPTQTTSRR